MQAAVYHQRGPARSVLEVVELPDPVPGPGEVRVRVRVSGVNPTDSKVRSAGPPLPAFGQIPNQDGAGDVDAVGTGVDATRLGQRVWVYHAAAGRPNGTAAQFTCAPADQAVPLPEGISYSQGAGLGIPYIHDRYPRPGRRLVGLPRVPRVPPIAGSASKSPPRVPEANGPAASGVLMPVPDPPHGRPYVLRLASASRTQASSTSASAADP